MSGTVIEEGLRGAGGYLLDGAGERFMLEYDPKGERATRDLVSRAMMDVIRKGRATPEGGIWIAMGHLGPENVRRQFKGMVERCADCGFDLAGGRVPVIPTAHYMMGGVAFEPDCTTDLPGLFAAGEDTGGVHGANRLGGNGVANSTVFGGIAGESMAGWVPRHGVHAPPDLGAVQEAIDAALSPLARPPGDLPGLRRRLLDVMWEDVGILRDAAELARGLAALDALAAEVDAAGVPDGDRRYNLTWQDRLNLESLVLVSRAITHAAIARTDSRGAHWREDFPETSDLATSHYTVIRQRAGALHVATEPVRFEIVAPGQTILREEAL